jgi:hypothetical protein
MLAIIAAYFVAIPFLAVGIAWARGWEPLGMLIPGPVTIPKRTRHEIR